MFADPFRPHSGPYVATWLRGYFIELLRGVILRNASAGELWAHVAGLAACGAIILTLSLARFRKQLD